jgi:hypothetical protein
MNILKSLRKSSLIVFSALLILLVSCSQYEPLRQAQRNFDYQLYEAYKSYPNSQINTNVLMNNKSSISKISQELLDAVNLEYGTNIILPLDVLELTDKTKEEIRMVSLEKGYIDEQDIIVYDGFINNLEKYDFETSLASFENDILNLNVSDESFEKYNAFANFAKVINDSNPEIFSGTSEQARGFWACFGAVVGLIAAIAGLYSCLTIVLCWLAYAGYLAAAAGIAACGTGDQ